MKTIVVIDKNKRTDNDFIEYNKLLLESPLFIYLKEKYIIKFIYSCDVNESSSSSEDLSIYAKTLSKNIVNEDPLLILCLGNIVEQNLKRNVFSGFKFMNSAVKIWGFDAFQIMHPEECISDLINYSEILDNTLEYLKMVGI